jgi:hypothetical protein
MLPIRAQWVLGFEEIAHWIRCGGSARMLIVLLELIKETWPVPAFHIMHVPQS